MLYEVITGTFAPYTKTFAASGGTQFPSNLSNNGTDWSYGGGFKVGVHVPFAERFVITSYSIHYTKLYEGSQLRRGHI